MRFLPDLPEERTGGMCLEFLAPVQASGKDGGLGVSAIYVDQLRKELDRMLRMAQENVAVSFQAVLTQDAGKLEQVEKTEPSHVRQPHQIPRPRNQKRRNGF